MCATQNRASKKSREGSLLQSIPEGTVVSHSSSSANGEENFNQKKSPPSLPTQTGENSREYPNGNSDNIDQEAEQKRQLKLQEIRNKVKNGFYGGASVDEDISEKLAKVFDRLL